MIAQVSPLRRLPTGLDFFDYQLTAEQEHQAKIGQLVVIPFKQQTIPGVIIALTEHALSPATKTIKNFLPFSLTTHQVTLALWLAQFYHLSLATILALFVPTIAKRSQALLSTQTNGTLPFPLTSITATDSHGWLLYQNWSALFSYLAEIIEKPLTGQTVFICPELYQQKLVVQLLDSLGYRQRTIWLPSKVQKNSYAAAWLDSQTKPFVVGGFQSLWLPYKKLQRAIIIEADNVQFHRAEQSPRIHLADVLVRWQEEYSVELLVTTISPNVALFQALQPLQLPPITVRTNPKPQRMIVDMRSERQVKNFDFLSEEAKTLITEASGAVLLYLNHHGSESLIACQRCHWLAPCPLCDKALIYDKTSNKLLCLNCGHSQAPIPHCLSCGSDHLKLLASGQKRLEREVKKIFPKKHITVLKRGAPLPTLDAQTIVIATSAIGSYVCQFQHCIMVQADSDLQRPDFQATDQLRRMIYKLQQISDNLLIQSYNPEHYVFTTLSSYADFLAQELTFRRDFRYPPLVPSYKIIFRRQVLPAVKLSALSKEVYNYLISQSVPAENLLPYSDHVIMRGSIADDLIDKLYKKFNNKLIVEINPYQWL